MLLDDLKQTMIAGLLRKSVTSCSRWAEKYRYMGRPIPGAWTFKYHPWGREMHDSRASKNIGSKAAQMGFTEWALNRTFFMIDVLQTDCLYVLPNKVPDATDFSSARFDSALELSPHLNSLFSDVKNVGHKRAGSVNLYVRGSRSRGGMKSIPVGHMTLDEFDEMDQAQVVLALERMSGQFEKSIDILSTPTIPDVKIDAEFKLSTQEQYHFRCPMCHRYTELTYPDCFVITAEEITDPGIHKSFIRCKECHNTLEHKTKYIWLKDKKAGGTGVWQPTVTADPDIRGFGFMNQLYSSTVTPVEFARSALKARFDPTEETEFNNSKLGRPHIVVGARVTDLDINACIGDYLQTEFGEGLTTMGVDVGNFLHVEIDSWTVEPGPDINTHAICKVLAIRKLKDFEELDQLMRQYQIHFAVVDMFPEKRKAKEFADRFFGFVKLCFYGRGVTSKSITEKQDGDLIVDHQITVDRTSWLDVSLGRFTKQRIRLPRDISIEYREQIKNQVRVYTKDKDGNPVGRYETVKVDHFGHARNYAEIALPFAASIVTGSDVRNFL